MGSVWMEMSLEELTAGLRDNGVVLLQGFFGREMLGRLRQAAGGCFGSIESGKPVPEPYRFVPHANCVLLSALLDFGIESEDALMAPLSAQPLAEMFTGLLGGAWRCRLEHSWARKKFAPRNSPHSGHNLQDWHQDAALGVQFPPEPGPEIPATRLATCWIPLHPCGQDSPGLEFIRQPQLPLLHFTELNDAALRQRFPADAFWAPALDLGDCLVFRNDVLHRTYMHGEMLGDRISIEYRIFPCDS